MDKYFLAVMNISFEAVGLLNQVSLAPYIVQLKISS